MRPVAKPALSLHTLAPRSRGPLVWLLVLALLAYGPSSVLVQLLGPAHRHGPAPVAFVQDWMDQAGALLQEARAWHADGRVRLLLAGHHRGPVDDVAQPPWAGPAPDAWDTRHADRLAGAEEPRTGHGHAHAAYQRHHHDAGDASVIALDGGAGAATADAASTAPAGSAALPLALAPAWVLPASALAVRSWPRHAQARWQDAAVPPPEHPPRA